MRAVAIFLLGALLGTALAAWAFTGPINWFATPPFPIGCDVSPGIKWALRWLIIWEGVGAAVGALGLLALYFFVRSRARHKAPPLPPAAPKPPLEPTPNAG